MTILQVMTLFIEGVLSFLSPCILPILPIYVGILSEGSKVGGKSSVVTNTLWFVLGVSLTFFLLAFTSSYLSLYLNQHRLILQVISAAMIMVFGLFQLGFIKLSVLFHEWSAKHKVYHAGQVITPFMALLMGFTFSFSWTPCVGPILASVFFYASSQSTLTSALMILVYCAGFILPFVLLAFFSKKMLTLFKGNHKWLHYSKLMSGLFLIGMALSLIWQLL